MTSPGPSSPTGAPDRSIDVIVPVYGAAGPFERCAESLGRFTDQRRHRIVVVLDGPPDPRAEEAVAELERLGLAVVVLRNGDRLGFVRSVNRGLRESSNDAVLLNSDTRVTARWLEKLETAADSAADVASVTPFSNNATICSLPRFLAENTIPAGHDVDSFAQLVEGCSQRVYPDLPTGVGVCLYLRRKVLDEIGLLDEEAFGFGYGEESELCMRATRAGYRHILDDATFIYHEGQRSFGATRRRRVARAHRVMRRRHPDYLRRVAAFIERDPLAPLRERVVNELRPRRAPARVPGLERVVHVVHGWPPWNHAGTELYARWLAGEQARDREVVVYSRVADPDRVLGDAIEHVDGGLRVRLMVNNFHQRNPISRNAIESRVLRADFGRLLDEVGPDLVHVHHLAGHCASLFLEVRRRRIPLVYQLQDWWTPCARVNLFHRDGGLCSGPAPGKCSRCLPLTGRRPARLWNPALYRLRELVTRRALASADALVMGSRAIEESYRALGFLPPDVPRHVIPYGVQAEELRSGGSAAAREPGPLRFGIIGSLLPHKGVHVAVEAFRDLPPESALLEIWGDPVADPAYAAALRERAAAGDVRFHGRFDEDRKGSILSSLDVLLVPSIGLESFGLVAREAFASGTPVIASRRGALAEIFDDGEGGALVEPEDPDALSSLLRSVIEDPSVLDRWRERLPPVRDAAAHALDVDRIYRAVLRARGVSAHSM